MRVKVGHIGVATIVDDRENLPAVAGECNQASVARGQRVDDLILAGPQTARSLPLSQRVNLASLGHRDAGVSRLQRLRLDDGDGCGANSLHGQRRQWIAALVAHAGRVDGPVCAHGHRRDLAPWSLEQHVAFALRIDSVDQPRTIRAGNQVAFGVPGQRADVLLVALEERFRLCVGPGGVDAVHRSRTAGGDVQPPGCVEGQVPYVVRLPIRFVGAWIFLGLFSFACLFLGLGLSSFSLIQLAGVEDHRGAAFILFRGRIGLQLVNLPAGQRSRVERSILPQANNLHAHIPGLEERKRFAVLAHAQYRGRRGGSHKGRSAFVDCYRPHECRGCGEYLGQARPLAQMAVAGKRNPLRRALFKLLDAGLGPQVGALRQGRKRVGDGCSKHCRKGGKAPCGAEAASCRF